MSEGRKRKVHRLRGYAAMGEPTFGLTGDFGFYNAERPHRSLANHTPDRVYASARGGGAKIVDRVGKEAKSETIATPGQRRPAACEGECTA